MKVFALILLITVSLVLANVHPDLSFIDEINNLSTTWIAGENKKFTNQDLKQIQVLLGSLKNPKGNTLRMKTHSLKSANLPESYDLREAYPNCESLREVRDQSNCGSCWAFGAVEAMSDRICIASGQKLQTRISAEDLVSCCDGCGYGCQGGYPESAWEYFQDTGLVTGGLYGQNNTCLPYKFKPCDHHVHGKYGPCGGADYPTPKCTNSCNSEYRSAQWAQDKWFASDAYSLQGEQDMMTEIYNHGSIEVSFTVYADFPNYKSGVYQHVSGGALGGHAVKCIGWGVENGTNYWLIVNSWNEGWGDNGTFKILRGSNHCGIEAGPCAGIPILK